LASTFSALGLRSHTRRRGGWAIEAALAQGTTRPASWRLTCC
jgi:hypothetical protein